MKDLKRIIKDKTCLVFLDFEATQISHELIQIGAVKTYIRDDLTIKKVFKPFETLVKPKNRVGKIVTDLTGITDFDVKSKGVPYRVALQGLHKYCGRDFDRCLFVCYGNSDGTILRATAEHNMDASMPETMYVVRHLFDYCSFASRFVKGDDGNPMSLSRILKVFEVPFDGHAHSAIDDAKNLLALYQAVLSKKDIVKREYMKVLAHHTRGNNVLLEMLRRLTEGETVTPDDFDAIVEKSLA